MITPTVLRASSFVWYVILCLATVVFLAIAAKSRMPSIGNLSLFSTCLILTLFSLGIVKLLMLGTRISKWLKIALFHVTLFAAVIAGIAFLHLRASLRIDFNNEILGVLSQLLLAVPLIVFVGLCISLFFTFSKKEKSSTKDGFFRWYAGATGALIFVYFFFIELIFSVARLISWVE
jgi:hypothetical protein